MKFATYSTVTMFLEKGRLSILLYCLIVHIKLFSSYNNEMMLGINTAKCGQRPFSSRYKIVGGQKSRAGDWCVSFFFQFDIKKLILLIK
jgi:hypothetical protein